MATRSALRSKVRSRGVKLKWGESAPSFRHQLLHKRLPPAQDELQDDTRPLLIVIGGGFAGTLVCRKMTRDYHVVLIDAKEYFEYYPGICRTYADPKDYLVVACGSQYGINLQAIQSASTGHECLWYPTCLQSSMPDSRWNTLDERFLAGRRRHIDREYNELVELNRKGATILVVGAGFVGIEFATEVKHFFSNIDIVIVEARDACIGVMPEKCIEYVKSYLARKDIKVIYNQAYKEFMSATDSIPADFSKANQSLQELAKEWGITEPSRIYMAVGLRPINSFMPAQCLSPGKRGGWINVNKYQEVMLETHLSKVCLLQAIVALMLRALICLHSPRMLSLERTWLQSLVTTSGCFRQQRIHQAVAALASVDRGERKRLIGAGAPVYVPLPWGQMTPPL